MGKGAKKASSGIGSVLSGVGKAIPVVGAAVMGAAAGFTVMAKAAYDDANAQAKLQRSLLRTKGVTKKAARATESWVDQMRLATLVSKDDLRQGLGELTKATGSLSKAQSLSMLAWDVAVGTGKEYGEVLEAMTEAAGGNAGALQEQAQWLKVGKDGTLTFKSAVEQLTTAYGGAAKAAADKDVFGRIGAAFELIGSAIGGAALPLLEDLSDWFSDKANIGKIEEWIGKLQTWATNLGEDVVAKAQEFIDWLNSPAGKQAMQDFVDRVKSIATAFDAVVTAVDASWGKLKDFIAWANGLPDWIKVGPLAPFRLLPDVEGSSSPVRPAPGINGNESMRRPTAQTTTTINVTVNSPKPERASASVAAALRIARPPAGYAGGGAW